MELVRLVAAILFLTLGTAVILLNIYLVFGITILVTLGLRPKPTRSMTGLPFIGSILAAVGMILLPVDVPPLLYAVVFLVDPMGVLGICYALLVNLFERPRVP